VSVRIKLYYTGISLAQNPPQIALGENFRILVGKFLFQCYVKNRLSWRNFSFLFSVLPPQKSIPGYYPKLCDDSFTLHHFLTIRHIIRRYKISVSALALYKQQVNNNTRSKVGSVSSALRIHHFIEIAEPHTICNTYVLWSVLFRWLTYKSKRSWRTEKG